MGHVFLVSTAGHLLPMLGNLFTEGQIIVTDVHEAGKSCQRQLTRLEFIRHVPSLPWEFLHSTRNRSGQLVFVQPPAPDE